jgi:diacylglycerol kinase family enzyme
VLRAGQNPSDAGRDARTRASTVVAAGGDGTVSGVAASVVGSQTALGILPLGSLNHFAKDLHIPLDLRHAVAVVAAGHLAQVDVGQVNDRVFINNSSIGIYPGIVEEREDLRRQGHRKWPAAAIATYRVLRRYRGVTVRIEVDGRQRTWRTPFVFVGTNEYTIDGIRLGSRARLDQGKLFVYVAPRARTRDLPKLLALALLGRATRSGTFEIISATELTIDTRTPRRIRVAADGEVTTMSTPLRYRTCPGALQVIVPQT